MKIELLYIPDCPNREPAAQVVREALIEQGIAPEMIEIEVADPAQAQALAFPGSPTIRVDGQDVEPATPASQQHGLMCRSYLVQGRREGVPPRDWVRKAISAAASRKE